MEILKSKGNLKNTTVEDVAFAGTSTQQVFFQDTENISSGNEAALLKRELDALTNTQENEAVVRAKYNNSLPNLDERYTSLTPLNSYIVRMFILEDEVKQIGESSLILPKTTFTRKQTNAGGIGDKIIDPFRFKSVAIIVAVPKHESELKPGMKVHIVKPRPIVDGDAIVGYTAEYVHPDYNDSQVPQSPKDVDFGYAIISRQEIKVIV